MKGSFRSPRRAAILSELRPMIRLSAPLALAELGWMVMGIVDTFMAGRLGAAAVGAGTLGTMLFYPIAIAGTGMLLGMDTLVSQSHGADDPLDCRRSLVGGLWLSAMLTLPLAALIYSLVPMVRAAGTNPHVLAQFVPFLDALLWSIPPLLLFAALRRYLQAVEVVKPILFALISANIVNLVGDWVLMFGHWGAPAMGMAGSGLSTTIARAYMAGVLLGAALWHERRSGNLLFQVSWRPDLSRIVRLIGLGIPAALQMLFEGAVFGVVTVWAARLDEVSLAAHGLAVQTIATTFMLPLGISSAAAVRVGQAIGRKDRPGAAVAGWTALLLSACVMGTAALLLGFAPRFVVGLFIQDPAVIGAGATLLRIAALFELFDGFQIVATGALRGLGDTRSPMIAHLLGYWAIGIPISYILCFPLHKGAPGIWIGLTTALIVIGVALTAKWIQASQRPI